jgi:hypothetical protein
MVPSASSLTANLKAELSTKTPGVNFKDPVIVVVPISVKLPLTVIS